MTESETEVVDPEQFDPDAQEGVDYQKPKNLDAAGEDHPIYQRVSGVDDLSVDVGDTVGWNVPATILRHMSDSLYQSDEATVREFIANAETACLRVKEGDAQIIPEDYQPIVEVTWNKSTNRLVIQDNGVGIASKTAVEVLRNIGVTTTRDTGSKSGKFGMGLASFLKLIGPMNSMIMKTRSRHTDENYAAYINLGGFDPIGGGMDDGEYGTRFEMYPKDQDAEIRNAVEKYAEHLRVPLHYEEYDSSGTLSFDEDWGGKKFEDEYAEGSMTTTVEKQGLFKAVMSPDANSKTLLLSMEIDRNTESDNATFESPYPFDVRLHDESGAVVHCECEDTDHVGMTPLADAEYRVRESERRRGYIPESDLGSNDITLPEPTTSRDKLQEDEEFWKWLSAEIDREFKSECKELFRQYEDIDELIEAEESNE